MRKRKEISGSIRRYEEIYGILWQYKQSIEVHGRFRKHEGGYKNIMMYEEVYGIQWKYEESMEVYSSMKKPIET